MIRWLLVPLTLAILGLAIGLLVLFVLLQMDGPRHVHSWNILIPLATCSAIIGCVATIAMLRFRHPQPITVRDHLRHMWLVYPFWMLTSVGLGHSHVAILYIFPFAALSGVMIGNFVAIARAAHVVQMT